ncbi:probable 3-deoxy-D-manno-octulosonic acid transferase, mitochondrial [Impatiens glandulifera]|uniref:probable 3-deoxy-D-manno-octulosonic acid transferase, mitochondrial n=1 Tax=Impatiens glandulifera TaxID=253017 RepID=UPI001FB070BA|nr:probable 3-deoxy-D-manno-octulosonic acid transferase, mitochondrial [Impatiens glandulifera]
MMATEGGKILYLVYRGLSYGLTPLVYLHLRWRHFRGLEHPIRWRERLGLPSRDRPPGHLLWFHAVSLGEGMAAIPMIKCCIERRPNMNILMTTTTLSAFQVLKDRLPSNVIYQFAPLDIPAAVDAFLEYWRPNAILLMESELWPNLIMHASRNGVALALLNARMSSKSFASWSGPVALPLVSLMLSKFSLISPLSMTQGINLQLLQAPPFIINFSGDLKYVMEEFEMINNDTGDIEDLRALIGNRQVWMAASIHKGEEEVILGAHKCLKERHPDVVTIIVPRHPHHGQEIAHELQKQGIGVSLRSRKETIEKGNSIYVVDTLGELRQLYRLVPIAVVGGSLLPGLAGHNISEAAAAGCVVLTGHHVGHFSHMVHEMQRLNPSSVTQISGEEQLANIIDRLLSDGELLKSHQLAATQAYRALSCGITESVWNMLIFHIFSKDFSSQSNLGSYKLK